VCKWFTKNKSDRFSNFTPPGLADFVPSSVAMNSDEPLKQTTEGDTPLRSGYTGNEDVAL